MNKGGVMSKRMENKIQKLCKDTAEDLATDMGENYHDDMCYEIAEGTLMFEKEIAAYLKRKHITDPVGYMADCIADYVYKFKRRKQ